jgi:hypothetical protein
MPRSPRLYLQVADSRVHGLAVHAGQSGDLGAGKRPLGHEQQRLELRLGQLAGLGVDRGRIRRRVVGGRRRRSASNIVSFVHSSEGPQALVYFFITLCPGSRPCGGQ